MQIAFNLDLAGVIEGTDKASTSLHGWDYLRKYQRLFEHLRNAPLNLVEIGVLGGASLKLWKSFFPNATIVGVDLNPKCARLAEDRVVIEIGSQDDPEFLARLAASYPPTIVIDDGSHFAHHQIYTFERLYPSILPGGFYIVEDLSFHVGPNAAQWSGPDGSNAVDYFSTQFRTRLVRQIETETADWGTQKYVFANTESVTAIDSAVVFRKKSPPPPAAETEAFADAYLAERGADAAAYVRVAKYMGQHFGASPQTSRAIRRAIEAGPDAQAISQLTDLAARLGHLQEAERFARQAAERFHDNANIWGILGRILARRGAFSEAETALNRALAIDGRNHGCHYQLSLVLDQSARPVEALRHAEIAASLAPDLRQAAEYQKTVALFRGKAAVA